MSRVLAFKLQSRWKSVLVIVIVAVAEKKENHNPDLTETRRCALEALTVVRSVRHEISSSRKLKTLLLYP